MTAGCDLIQDRWSVRARVLALLTPLAFAGVCVNPYGIGYFQTHLRVGSFTFAHIAEWAPIWRNPPMPADILIPVVLLAAGSFAAWVINPQRRWSHLGWLLLLGALFAQARRNIAPFALTSLMVLAVNAPALNAEAFHRTLRRITQCSSSGAAPRQSLPLRWLFQGGLLVWLILEALMLLPRIEQMQRPADIRLEQGVARFIRDNNLKRKIFQ